jgi:alkanesulfonate monooxygenase SsuD/methylene tetrahydromethanopterin reductase-like flavin-dependent oxidoreductase (luciferase family)
VAQHADEWDLGGGLPPETYRARIDRLVEHCRAVGRDPAEIGRSYSTAYFVGRDERELRARAERLRAVFPSLARLEAPAIIETLRGSGWKIGTPPELVANFNAIAAAGAQRIILQHNDQDDLDALELIAREVSPRVGGGG